MKETILKVLVLLFIIVVTGFACYNAGKSKVYESQDEYYNKTEALLDSINVIYNDSFYDTVMKTDTYYEYEVARENLLK